MTIHLVQAAPKMALCERARLQLFRVSRWQDEHRSIADFQGVGASRCEGIDPRPTGQFLEHTKWSRAKVEEQSKGTRSRSLSVENKYDSYLRLRGQRRQLDCRHAGRGRFLAGRGWKLAAHLDGAGIVVGLCAFTLQGP